MKTYRTYSVFDKLSENVLSVFVARNDEVAKKSIVEFCKKQGLVNPVDYEKIVLTSLGLFNVPDEVEELKAVTIIPFEIEVENEK